MAKKLIIVVLLLFLSQSYKANAIEFDELDKPPEGAHKGQMFLGASVYIGWPSGDAIDAENNFLRYSTYTFENDVVKALEVSHLNFSIGLTFEYMPLNHIGSTIKVKRTYIVQQTNYGQDYENWRGYLYRDVAFYLGPSIHSTNRKRWDFVLIPILGYNFSKYVATPIAKNIEIMPEYTGDRRESSKGFSFGSELNCTFYFSGGLYISMGGEWIRNRINLGSAFDLTNPQTDIRYTRRTSIYLDSINIILSIGYAFSN